MGVDEGVIVPSGLPLADIYRPLVDTLRECYWLIDVQSGAFSTWDLQYELIDKLYDQFHLAVPACERTGTSCWKPGFLPAHLDRLNLDEWSDFVGIRAESDEAAVARATTLARAGFAKLPCIPDPPDIFYCYVDGWWEIYTPFAQWRGRLLAHLPGSYLRPVAMKWQPPLRA